MTVPLNVHAKPGTWVDVWPSKGRRIFSRTIGHPYREGGAWFVRIAGLSALPSAVDLSLVEQVPVKLRGLVRPAAQTELVRVLEEHDARPLPADPSDGETVVMQAELLPPTHVPAAMWGPMVPLSVFSDPLALLPRRLLVVAPWGPGALALLQRDWPRGMA